MDNPVRSYYDNGNIETEHWYKNLQLHRLNKPAIILYYENGKIKNEEWCENNKTHRLNGPADIWYNEDGNIEKTFWWVNGIQIEQPYDNYPLTTEQQIEMKLKYA